MTDLARELAILLPCTECLHTQGSGHWCSDDGGGGDCDNCTVRPAILTWAERKLDEANELRRGAEYDAGCLRADLDAAKADGELLAKVEKLLRERRDEERTLWLWAALPIDDVAGEEWVSEGIAVRFDDHPGRANFAPTLPEALRKLVGSES